MLSAMTRSAEKVLKEAVCLSESERASIAGALIESLHGELPSQEETWEEVIERRVRDLEAGTDETLAWSEVRARLFSGFE